MTCADFGVLIRIRICFYFFLFSSVIQVTQRDNKHLTRHQQLLLYVLSPIYIRIINMLVYEFMIPADKVITCEASETIENVLDKIIDNRISAVVVAEGDKAIGIITKTDISKAYKKGYPLEKTAGSIMSRELKTVKKGLPRDTAASVFSEHKIHHAIVVDDEGTFVGFISAWDCAKEGFMDTQAWPWTRRMMSGGRKV
jgi:CBS domain-containing protein